MATESHPVPKLAQTALNLLRQQFQQGIDAIGKEACEALGLDVTLGYRVNFDTGVITREIPDSKPALVSDIGPDGVSEAAAS